MKNEVQIIHDEIGDMEAVMNVACTIESAQRRSPVSRRDLAVQLRAADIILNLGAYLRAAHSGQTAG